MSRSALVMAALPLLDAKEEDEEGDVIMGGAPAFDVDGGSTPGRGSRV